MVLPRGVKFAWFIYYALGIFKIVIAFQVMESELDYLIIVVNQTFKKNICTDFSTVVNDPFADKVMSV